MENARTSVDGGALCDLLVVECCIYYKNVFEDVIANSFKYSVGYSNFASAKEFMGNFDGSSSDLWVKCRDVLSTLDSLRDGVRASTGFEWELQVQAKVVDVAQKCMSTQTQDPKMLDALSETLKVALEVWPKYKDIDKLSQQTSKMLEAEFLGVNVRKLVALLLECARGDFCFEKYKDGIDDLICAAQGAEFDSDQKGQVDLAVACATNPCATTSQRTCSVQSWYRNCCRLCLLQSLTR